MSKGAQSWTLATMGTTSITMFFYAESIREGALSFMVYKLGPCCGNTRSNLLCQEHCVSCWSFLFLCWRRQLCSYMNDHTKTWGSMFWLICEWWAEVALCVPYNYIWGKIFTKTSFAVKIYITTVEICLIWWICFCYQLPGYHLFCSWGNTFFHGPSLLSMTIISTCLSDFHLSVSGVAPVFPFRFIKSQLLQCALNLWSRTPTSYEANRFSRAVNRLYLQSDS